MSFKRLPEGMQAEVVSVGPTANFTAADAPPERISEKEFQARVVAYAKRCGWTLIYHTYDSRRSKEGFPDLLFLRGKKIIVAELKVPPNVATDAQLQWLDGFRAAKVLAYLWTPEDWAEIVKVLE